MNPITASMNLMINTPQEVVDKITLIEGPIDIYFWFEGPYGVSIAGSSMMMKDLIKPLLDRKKDATLCLYSLRSWKFEKNVSQMEGIIPRINNQAIQWVQSAEFFQYCVNPSTGIAEWISIELPKKKWLFEISEYKEKKNKTVKELFEKCSCFDFVKDKDVSNAYSLMQYVEGYYLVQRSVKKGMEQNQKKIQIVFALPNDEGKFYEDFPDNINSMLNADFGKAIDGIEIDISFQFFEYTKNNAKRPYLDGDRYKKLNQIQRLFL